VKPEKKIEVSKEAKQLAAMLLDVLAGLRTPPQAAEALGLSLQRYYQLEDRGLNGLLLACEARPRGRQTNIETQLHVLMKENEQLQRSLARQQSLVRLTQRAVGVPPPAPTPVKGTGKRRKRKPAVRALRRANRLREEADMEAGAEGAGTTTE